MYAFGEPVPRIASLETTAWPQPDFKVRLKVLVIGQSQTLFGGSLVSWRRSNLPRSWVRPTRILVGRLAAGNGGA